MSDSHRTQEQQALHSHYTALNDTFAVTERNGDYGSLVVPTGNSDEPVHRWFHFKEGYSHQLVARVLKDADWQIPEQYAVIDPFAGSGTSLVSALDVGRSQEAAATIFGVERNPVMHLISSAKLVGALRGQELAEEVREDREHFTAALSKHLQTDSLATNSPTLNNPLYFDPEAVRRLIALGRAASDLGRPDTQTIFRACAAISVDPAGRLRRDGRALRYAPNRVALDPIEAFMGSLDRMIEDLDRIDPVKNSTGNCVLGDARDLPVGQAGMFDWAIFSPPYPNNIDYTEVYKTEGWALEMYMGASDVRKQRLSTLRSHPSILFEDAYGYVGHTAGSAVGELLDPLIQAVPEDRYTRGRIQVIRGYADDMFRVLNELHERMRPGGRACIVVGNSLHGGRDHQFVVASDLIIARLAELTGWTVDEIRVCRRPTRRADDAGWLRESAVMLSLGI